MIVRIGAVDKVEGWFPTEAQPLEPLVDRGFAPILKPKQHAANIVEPPARGVPSIAAWGLAQDPFPLGACSGQIQGKNSGLRPRPG